MGALLTIPRQARFNIQPGGPCRPAGLDLLLNIPQNVRELHVPKKLSGLMPWRDLLTGDILDRDFEHLVPRSRQGQAALIGHLHADLVRIPQLVIERHLRHQPIQVGAEEDVVLAGRGRRVHQRVGEAVVGVVGIGRREEPHQGPTGWFSKTQFWLSANAVGGPLTFCLSTAESLVL